MTDGQIDEPIAFYLHVCKYEGTGSMNTLTFVTRKTCVRQLMMFLVCNALCRKANISIYKKQVSGQKNGESEGANEIHGPETIKQWYLL